VESRRPAEAVADPRDAVARALAAAGRDGAVVVAGSLFLAGEAYAVLCDGALFPVWQGWERDGTQAAG
jgi:hypothetical protein